MREFDLATFYDGLGAPAKERHVLRQDLVRGLKDYYLDLYGYDKYGAETVLLLSERMGQPRIFGYAARRILADRRVSDATKRAVALQVLEMADIELDRGIPFGLALALLHLARRGSLDVDDLRFGLLMTSGSQRVFEGLERPQIREFVGLLIGFEAMPAEERLFWLQAVLVQLPEGTLPAEMIGTVMRREDFPPESRRELCWSWIYRRQPRLTVSVPEGRGPRALYVADHMPFWIAHSPSWPTTAMIRQGLIWLARLGEDPLTLAEMALSESGDGAEPFHAAAADILAEHRDKIGLDEARRLIERGIGLKSYLATRRRFYRLGSDLYGESYLQRATEDSAGSVRQWAARQIARGT